MPKFKIKVVEMRQPSSRHLSQVLELDAIGYSTCCDCGLVHEDHYRARIMADGVHVYKRTRRHIGLTRKKRAVHRFDFPVTRC